MNHIPTTIFTEHVRDKPDCFICHRRIDRLTSRGRNIAKHRDYLGNWQWFHPSCHQTYMLQFRYSPSNEIEIRCSHCQQFFDSNTVMIVNRSYLCTMCHTNLRQVEMLTQTTTSPIPPPVSDLEMAMRTVQTNRHQSLIAEQFDRIHQEELRQSDQVNRSNRIARLTAPRVEPPRVLGPELPGWWELARQQYRRLHVKDSSEIPFSKVKWILITKWAIIFVMERDQPNTTVKGLSIQVEYFNPIYINRPTTFYFADFPEIHEEDLQAWMHWELTEAASNRWTGESEFGRMYGVMIDAIASYEYNTDLPILETIESSLRGAYQDLRNELNIIEQRYIILEKSLKQFQIITALPPDDILPHPYIKTKDDHSIIL